ncbi:MAG: hypothetical protein WBZ36_05165 [Candidatus Nitrosopolaris sp.]
MLDQKRRQQVSKLLSTRNKRLDDPCKKRQRAYSKQRAAHFLLKRLRGNTERIKRRVLASIRSGIKII